MDAAFWTDIFAKHNDPAVQSHLVLQRSANRCDHIDPLTSRMGDISRSWRRVAFGPLAAHRLKLTSFEKDIPGKAIRICHGSSLSFLACFVSIRIRFCLDIRPSRLFEHCRDQERAELWQRISCPFRSDKLFRLIRLDVLEAVSLQSR